MGNYFVGQTVYNSLQKEDEVVVGVSEEVIKTSNADGFVSDYDIAYILPMSSKDIDKKYHHIKCHVCKELEKVKEVSGDYPLVMFEDIYGNMVKEYPYFCYSCGAKLFEEEPIG